MDVPDTLIVGTFGTMLTAMGGMGTVIGILWKQNQRLITNYGKLTQRMHKADIRWNRILLRLSNCPSQGCPYRGWSTEEMEDLEDLEQQQGDDIRTEEIPLSAHPARTPFLPPHGHNLNLPLPS